MKWVNGDSELPEDEYFEDPRKYVVRFMGDDPRSGIVAVDLLTLEQMENLDYGARWEWLDESK